MAIGLVFEHFLETLFTHNFKLSERYFHLVINPTHITHYYLRKPFQNADGLLLSFLQE